MSVLLRRCLRYPTPMSIRHALHRPSRSPSIQTRVLSTEPAAKTSPTSASISSSSDSMPKIVQYLGYGGALPFLFGGVGSLLLPDGYMLAHATQLYGASILSFLGGVHWGLALRAPSTRDFIYSVTPSLIAWGAALAPPPQGLAVLSGGFVAAWMWDEVRFRGGSKVPSWYRRLRRPLTIAAASGCALAWRAVRGKENVEEIGIREADAVVVSTSAYEGGKEEVGERGEKEAEEK